ncbi:unnamed protein product [Rotaria sordida]|uniref:Uncharacterized protein n=1 Tax=Rotaria sordida TaxID=392033 RepID=A0A815EPR2_9BILA|nr:unnamed protein product [Rotaria sordida]CAF0872771.1 unnamed protein product [Rotaria sordida]CAF0981569.1 unnamed protein product [Rotaria sordida]CAF1318193.1 unnamed protein product [Rotaria sordida]CAF3595202.1 unnamed protein product [Rotaria sordida]
MTTVEFGGGPTLEARRQFVNLKDGSEIPKYTGHIHQLRFRQGHTYGEETHRLSKEFPHLLKRSRSDVVIKYDQSDPYITREFSDGLIPGYTGYVPQRKYQHGNRYRIETDACVAGTKTAYEKERQKVQDLQRTISAYPKTKSSNSGTVLKHFLDYHRAYHPTECSQQDDRRPFVEPPMPGYNGYIPRMSPIGVGLGTRYHEATKRSLNRFAVETTNSMTNFSTSVDNQPISADYNNQSNCTRSLIDFTRPRPISSSSHRIYAQSGMIPRYTGYLPQRKYRVGQTFGDTTRDLPVCSHSGSNYGDMVRSKTFIDSSSTNSY